MKKINQYITRLSFMLAVCATMALVACNDNIADEDLYTYKPEMLSDFLRNNADFSDFAAIVEKAGKMELLSTYGTYTCFAPTNEAIRNYLSANGLSGIDALSPEDCDTIASTLLVDKMYSMADLSDLQGFIEDQNMLGRPLACEPVKVLIGEDSVTTYRINRSAMVIYELANDSVDNGIVHPISSVAESSNQTLPTIMREDPSISLFNLCLEMTKLDQKMQRIKDASYDPRDWEYMEGLYRSHEHNNYCWVPQSRNYGYTAFVVPDRCWSGLLWQVGRSPARPPQPALQADCLPHPQP